MNYCAIISEFNPLTNGHAHIINQAKLKTGLDVICLMSGNFVQRGEASILNKYERASSAIKCGASLVLELPIVYALSSAEIFADGAIKILKGITNITHLVFGVETDNTMLLEKLAKIKVDKEKFIQDEIKKQTKKGLSYNKIMISVLKDLLPNQAKEIDDIFTGANNILALEYLTAIYREKANLTPVYVKRTDKGYNSINITKLIVNNKKTLFAPASFIREQLYLGNLKKIKNLTDLETFNNLSKQTKEFYVNKEIRLNALILNELRKHDINSLSTFFDYTQSLSGLINKLSNEKTNVQDIILTASGKSFRPSRVKKLLLYPLLSITKENFNTIYNQKQSTNVLAVAENKKQELTNIKSSSETNIIVSIKDYNSLENKKALELNQLASDIYNLISEKPLNKDKTIFI